MSIDGKNMVKTDNTNYYTNYESSIIDWLSVWCAILRKHRNIRLSMEYAQKDDRIFAGVYNPCLDQPIS